MSQETNKDITGLLSPTKISTHSVQITNTTGVPLLLLWMLAYPGTKYLTKSFCLGGRNVHIQLSEMVHTTQMKDFACYMHVTHIQSYIRGTIILPHHITNFPSRSSVCFAITALQTIINYYRYKYCEFPYRYQLTDDH